MLVKRFLTWVQTAPTEARAAGTAALARALVGSPLTDADRAEAEAALTLMADDADPEVRRAIVDVLADSPEAPAHLVLALGNDVPDIALEIWRRSPVLTDGDLVDAVATRGLLVQEAIAGRRPLAAPVAAAIAEVADAPAAACLATNRDADIPAFSLVRMAERFAGRDEVLSALLARPDLPVVARYTLTTERLAAASGEPGRVRREAQEKAALSIALSAGSDELADLARHLRATSHLTASLLLRLVVCGGLPLFHAALAELSGMPVRRVSAVASETRGGAFEALCRKAGLPSGAVPVFHAALAAAHDLRRVHQALPGLHGQAFPARAVLARVADSVARLGLHPESGLAVALRRLEADVAREDALRAASELLRQDPLEPPPLLLERSMAMGQAPQPDLRQDNEMLSLPAPQDWSEPAPQDWSEPEPRDWSEPPPSRAPSASALAALLERTVAEALSQSLPESPALDLIAEAPAEEPPAVGEFVDEEQLLVANSESDVDAEVVDADAEADTFQPDAPAYDPAWSGIDAWWAATQQRLSSAA